MKTPGSFESPTDIAVDALAVRFLRAAGDWRLVISPFSYLVDAGTQVTFFSVSGTGPDGYWTERVLASCQAYFVFRHALVHAGDRCRVTIHTPPTELDMARLCARFWPCDLTERNLTLAEAWYCPQSVTLHA